MRSQYNFLIYQNTYCKCWCPMGYLAIEYKSVFCRQLQIHNGIFLHFYIVEKPVKLNREITCDGVKAMFGS